MSNAASRAVVRRLSAAFQAGQQRRRPRSLLTTGEGDGRLLDILVAS